MWFFIRKLAHAHSPVSGSREGKDPAGAIHVVPTSDITTPTSFQEPLLYLLIPPIHQVSYQPLLAKHWTDTLTNCMLSHQFCSNSACCPPTP